MFQRSLPTLKSEAYNKARQELTFISDATVQDILRRVGSNKFIRKDILVGIFRVGIEIQLGNLVHLGYLIEETKPTEFPLGGQPGTVHKILEESYYRVNWKQIRQLNKAISLL